MHCVCDDELVACLDCTVMSVQTSFSRRRREEGQRPQRDVYWDEC